MGSKSTQKSDRKSTPPTSNDNKSKMKSKGGKRSSNNRGQSRLALFAIAMTMLGASIAIAAIATQFEVGAFIESAYAFGMGPLGDTTRFEPVPFGAFVMRLSPFLPPRIVMRLADHIVRATEWIKGILVPPQMLLSGYIVDFLKNRALYAAVDLKIADAVPLYPIDKEWPSIKEIAEACGVKDVDGLYRLMRLLCSIDVFIEHPNMRFSHSRLSIFLRSDHPATQKHMIISLGEEQYQSWNGLAAALREGPKGKHSGIAFNHIFSEKEESAESLGYWPFLNRPENARKLHHFQRMFEILSEVTTPPLCYDYNWKSLESLIKKKTKSDHITIADIGGGLGSVLAALLQELPSAQGILMDQPEVIAHAKRLPRWTGQNVTTEDYSQRVRLESGSFLDSATIPTDADVYVMRMILHDWNDEESIFILENIRTAIQRSGRDLASVRVIVMDTVLSPQGSYSRMTPPYEFNDVHMLATLRGKERTEAQFKELFIAAGYQFVGVTYTRGFIHIVEGIPQAVPR